MNSKDIAIRDFINALSERADYYEWSYAWRNPYITPSILTRDYLDCSGSDIRLLRSRATSIEDIFMANSPHLIGVNEPAWIWRRLTLLLDTITSFNAWTYDYRKYDNKVPGAVYMYDRMLIKEVFAGGAFVEFELGQKVDGTQVDDAIFEGRATQYLIVLLSQIAQAQATPVAAATPATTEPTESVESTDEDTTTNSVLED